MGKLQITSDIDSGGDTKLATRVSLFLLMFHYTVHGDVNLTLGELWQLILPCCGFVVTVSGNVLLVL
jgi:hypothetical protein